MRRGSKDSTVCTMMTAYILWERINYFIKGQVMDDGSSVEWAKEDNKDNKKELKRIELTSSIVQTWYLIFLFFIIFLSFGTQLKEKYIYDFTFSIKYNYLCFLGFIVFIEKKIIDSILNIKNKKINDV
jgi:hypothetical protein